MNEKLREQAERAAHRVLGPLTEPKVYDAYILGWVHGYDASKPKPEGTQAFIAAYCAVFKARYGFNPPVGGRNAGIAKRIAQAVGSRAERYIEAYFGMPKAYFLERKHDLSTMEMHLNTIADFAENGRVTTTTQAKAVERRETNAQAFAHLREPTHASDPSRRDRCAGSDDGNLRENDIQSGGDNDGA